MGAGLPHTPTDRGKPKRLRVSSDRNAEETWLHRDRTESVCSSARRTSQAARSHRDRGTEEPAIQAGRLAQSRAPGPSTEPNLPRQAGATQERCRSWRRWISTSTPSPISWSACGLKSLSRFSERVTRVEGHLSDQNADREGNEFGISRAMGRVVSAFRRGSFEVTAWDGRPWCGSCG
jgi:hypothetical protein